jgi:hypothetical protein
MGGEAVGEEQEEARKDTRHPRVHIARALLPPYHHHPLMVPAIQRVISWCVQRAACSWGRRTHLQQSEFVRHAATVAVCVRHSCRRRWQRWWWHSKWQDTTTAPWSGATECCGLPSTRGAAAHVCNLQPLAHHITHLRIPCSAM